MNKQGFGKLASLKEAKEIISNLTPKLETEIISIYDGLNRVLSKDITAQIDVPHFTRSAMDGFAVIAEDTFKASNTHPLKLKKIDFVSAGTVSKKELKSGECIEITTGSAIPKHTTAVLMMEYTQKEKDVVEIFKSCAPGENIINIGSDTKRGTSLFTKGTILNPRYLGVIASQGIRQVEVFKKPNITYFASGNEIVDVRDDKQSKKDEILEIGKVFDINSITVMQTLKQIGCDVNYLGIAKDNKQEIINKIKEGLSSDIIVFSGGSSLGGEDFMYAAVAELGKVIIHGIAAKPGKPVLVGVVKDKNQKEKVVLGLPGYPTSTLSNVYLLLIPIVEQMLNCSLETRKIKAKLSRKIASTIGRYEFLPVELKEQKDSEGQTEYIAIPIMRGSSAITSLSLADGFVGIDENTEILNKDDEVDVILMI